MAIPADPVPVETLLAHREWVRRVARALVTDENVADDLEQDLWVGALTRPPRIAKSARGWLATALRHSFLNRGRAEVRRQRREESVSRPERQPSTAEVVAAAEAHQSVVAEVMRLPEPYRGTILLRYFQGLAPAAIAARENVPIETVHTRLRRAREALRERLAAHEDRRGWRFALAPLLGSGATPDSIAPHVAGGLIVKTTSKIAIGALLAALLSGVALLGLRGTRGPDTVAPPASATAPAAPESAPSPRMAAAPQKSPGTAAGAAMGPDETSPGPGTTVATGPTLRETPDSSRAPAPAGEIAGHVLHLKDRTPAVGAEVRLLGHGGPLPPGAALPSVWIAVTDVDGAFRLKGFPAATYSFRASMAGHSEVMFTARVVESAGVGGIDVLLGPGGNVEGRVIDARGAAAEGLTVDLEVPGDNLAGIMKPTRTSTKTDADGMYRFSDLTPAYCTVTVKRGEGREQSNQVPVKEGETARLDFTSAAVLAGLLLGDGRAPVAGVTVGARAVVGRGMDLTRGVEGVTDAQGRFRLEGLEPGDWRITVMGGRTLGFNGEVRRQTVVAGENEVTLDLGTAAEVGGRVESLLVARALSWTEVQLLLLPTERTESGGLKRTEWTWPTVAFADKEGRFRFRGLRAGTYRLYADATLPGHAHWERDLEVLTGERKDGVEILLDRSKSGEVRFLVKDEGGKPLGEARFEVLTNGLGRSVQATSPEPGLFVSKLEAGPTNVHVWTGPWLTADVLVNVREGATVDVDVVLRPHAAPR